MASGHTTVVSVLEAASCAPLVAVELLWSDVFQIEVRRAIAATRARGRWGR